MQSIDFILCDLRHGLSLKGGREGVDGLVNVLILISKPDSWDHLLPHLTTYERWYVGERHCITVKIAACVVVSAKVMVAGMVIVAEMVMVAELVMVAEVEGEKSEP